MLEPGTLSSMTNILGDPSSVTTLTNKSRELIAQVNLLNRERAQLLETLLLLRKEGRQLSEDSQLLRKIATGLVLGLNS